MNIPEENLDDVVRDEEVVHEAYEDHKITPEDVSDIETVEQLQAESQTILSSAGANELAAVNLAVAEDSPIVLPTDNVKPDEKPQSNTAITQKEESSAEIGEVAAEMKGAIYEIKNIK